MLKILHIYAGNLFGGIETLLLTLAREEQKASFDQLENHFALCFEGRLSTELEQISGNKIYHLGVVKISRPWLVWRARQKLRALLTMQKFDVVICHACWPQAIFGSVVKTLGIPLVFCCHDVLGGTHWLERLAKRVEPDLVIANSVYTSTSVPKLYPKVKTEVFHLPCAPTPDNDSVECCKFIRQQLDTPENALVIIQVSRLEPWKGHSFLMQALGQLANRQDWVCWVVGGVQKSQEGEYLHQLKAQAESLGIADRIRFLGQRSDVPQLLAAADIHCQPNTGPEPFGITFIEALHSGLPVVTTAMGGALDIVDDTCGYLVPPGDRDKLAGILAYLIDNPELRADLGAAGQVRADYLCNPQQQLNKLYCLLSPLIQQEVIA